MIGSHVKVGLSLLIKNDNYQLQSLTYDLLCLNYHEKE